MSNSTENNDMVDEVLIDIEEHSQAEPTANECCIYRVPFKIRRMKADDYTPRLISIGPLHHGKKELADMENKKKRFMKCFRDETNDQKLDEISTFIKNNERGIRHSYAEISKLNSLRYRLMIMYDAIVIIGFFVRIAKGDRSDLLLAIDTQAYTLRSDLQLVENQLPYFVLEKIYEMYLPMAGFGLPTFMELCRSFFGQHADFKLNPLAPGETVKHFADWRRSTILKGHPEEQPHGYMVDFPCAMKLHESGVKFKSVERECRLKVKFEKRKHRIPCFNLHELQIPHFSVHSQTECLLRNILAFEQCHYPSDTRFCNYIIFLDYLIDTEKDVDLLVGEGVIKNNLGNNTLVANLVNESCRSMIT
ncbi:putative UPF0481 protein At3g02645 [Pistacia vera]|uniref:putative UPF0481 protein At3g02645 n=1 Tax=Pistacia vera TaxID=55513 RepID=UPI0012635FB2|nr:putative UPF0481 protein At3g02645 [Pistacia vera]